MAEAPLDLPRIWVEFTDPADTGQRFRCDLTWLTSSWTCIFGSGCQGIYAGRPDDGCCTLGAHFTDDDDSKRVEKAVKELGEDEWQYHPRPRHGEQGRLDREGGRRPQDQGRRRRLHLPQPARLPRRRRAARCTSTPSSPGVEPHTLKPDVCWQLPIRRTYRTVELPDEHELPRGDDHRVRPPRLGPRWPRPRLVLLRQPRGARRPRAGLPLQPRRAGRADGRGGLRRAGDPLRGAPRARSRPSARAACRKLLPLLVHPRHRSRRSGATE